MPCMMVISTLPPAPNAMQCQEPSGQIQSCFYMTQILSNGEQIVANYHGVSTANCVFTCNGPSVRMNSMLIRGAFSYSMPRSAYAVLNT
jgi:hypothetical protein